MFKLLKSALFVSYIRLEEKISQVILNIGISLRFNGMYQSQVTSTVSSNFLFSQHAHPHFNMSTFFYPLSYSSGYNISQPEFINCILKMNQPVVNNSTTDVRRKGSVSPSTCSADSTRPCNSSSAVLDRRPSSTDSVDSGIVLTNIKLSSNPHDENSVSKVSSRGFRRQLTGDMKRAKYAEQRESNIKNTTKSFSGAGIKRQYNKTGQSSPDISSDGASNIHQQPPNKKPFLLSNKYPQVNLKETSKEWQKLSSDIWHHYISRKQTDELYNKKMLLWNWLFNLLKQAYPFCGLYVVGSSMTGLGSSSSDTDMCLMLSHEEIDQKRCAIEVLKYIHKELRKFRFVNAPVLITATVPILKFTDNRSGIEVDLNVNNAVGIRNTQLLKCYAEYDLRVRPLVLIIKKWAQMQNINEAKCQTISSYSLVLMVIHFLQYGVDPPVLPCLQKLYPNKFVPNSDFRMISLNENLPIIPSKNKMSLGELLLAFLNYYANKFNFDKHTISIRVGCVLPTYLTRHQPSPKNTPHQWKYLCIEEPFDLTNTARSVYTNEAFRRILNVFRSSWLTLKRSKKLNTILLKL